MSAEPDSTNDEYAYDRKFTSLQGHRVSDGKYTLGGLPEGEDFREEENYETVKCGALKVSGVAFSAPEFSFGEYQTYIRVRQKNKGGLTNITFEEMD